MTIISTALLRFWHFQCPECGIGDQEIGALAKSQDIYCEGCLNEEERHVSLRRWPTEEAPDGIEAALRGRAA